MIKIFLYFLVVLLRETAFSKEGQEKNNSENPQEKILMQEPGKHIPLGLVYIKCSKSILLILGSIYFYVMVELAG